MTVSQEFLINTVLGFGTGIVAVFSVLMLLMWKHLTARLQALSAADTAIHAQMHDLMKTVMGHLKSEKSIETLREENARLRWMIKTVPGSDPDVYKGP